jgi:hypothetical protein
MNKKRLWLIWVVVLSITLVLPASSVKAASAHDDTTLEAGTLLYISDVAPAVGGTAGINISVSASSEVVSLTVNATTIDVSVMADSNIHLSSGNKKLFSNTLGSTGDTVCGADSSTFDYTANSTMSFTITFSDNGNCQSEVSTSSGNSNSGGGSYTPPPITPAVPAGQSTGAGATTVTVGGGATGAMGAVAPVGVNALMGEAATASFSLSTGGGGSHSLATSNVTANSVTVTISSNPITFCLAVGETKNVDLDGDGYRDVQVTLNRIVDGKADLTVKELTPVKISGVVPGNLIKIKSKTAVYYFGEDSKRYVFPHEKTYFTWYTDFSGVKTISDADMAKLPIGGLVTYRPGVKMVKFMTDNDVYVVAKGGTLRKLKDEQMAKDLYGSDWNKKIDDINDAFFPVTNLART